MSTFIHPDAIVDDEGCVPDGCRIWANAHVIKGAVLGEDCNIGEGAYIEKGVRLGKGCIVKNGVYIWEMVVAEDYVFFGPNCTLTNVFTPRAHPMFKGEHNDWRPTLIKEGATIGAGATVLCGVTLGRYCMIGAGAVVTRDVADHELVVGVPAKRIAYACECGRRLDDEFKCEHDPCRREYRMTDTGLVRV
ncbi:DapH/DapD/GlmU-related protein [Verrucomicrobiota bacterium]